LPRCESLSEGARLASSEDDEEAPMPRATTPEEDVLARLNAALRADPHADRASNVILELAEGILTMAGEVRSLAAKARALRRAASFPEVEWVVDRLCVAPAVRMTDGEIRDHVCYALLEDIAFDECRIVAPRHGHDAVAHDPIGARGLVRVEVTGGVVALDGDVPSLVHRRLAGVLAWWVPGTRAVENRLGVVPPERDNDGEITDAVRIVLEKDRLVDAAQIGVRTRRGNVTLSGTVRSVAQEDIAVRDAWYVQGVEDVTDEIVVVL
jgi:osmotically-inducible protein OsmY